MKEGVNMQITFKIDTWTTCSGKPAISFRCDHCNCSFLANSLTGYFYQSYIPKDNLEQALQAFVDSINNYTVMELFNKPKTGNKLYNQLCNCDSKITDIEYLKSVKQAKAILNRGLEILNKRTFID